MPDSRSLSPTETAPLDPMKRVLSLLPERWIVEVSGPWLRGDNPPVFGAIAKNVGGVGKSLIYNATPPEAALNLLGDALENRPDER